MHSVNKNQFRSEREIQHRIAGMYRRGTGDSLFWYCLLALVGCVILIVSPAAASFTTIPANGTVFIGETGLDITGCGVTDGDTIVWFSPGHTPFEDPPDAALVIGNAGSFIIAPEDFAERTGIWYALHSEEPVFLVNDPYIDIHAIDGANHSRNNMLVSKGTVLRFRIDTNLAGMTERNPDGIPVHIMVSSPQGIVYSSLIDDDSSVNEISTLIIDSDHFIVSGAGNDATGLWDTGKPQYPRGTYTFSVYCNVNSMHDTYGVMGKTISRTNEITIDATDISVTINHEAVFRTTNFSVTIEGQPMTRYVIWTKGTSSLPASQVPAICRGQDGVVRGDHDAGEYIFYGITRVRSDVPQIGGAGSPDHFSMVETDGHGKRTVNFSTTMNTTDQWFTIRAERYSASGPTWDYGEASIYVDKGEVTINGSGTRTYYLGEEVTFSGINTASDITYLFITGPNLRQNGADLANPSRSVWDTAGNWQSVMRTVSYNRTWEYRWRSGESMVDPGTYTVYAVSEAKDRSDLTGVIYTTVSVVIRKGFITATPSATTVPKGDNLAVMGMATGSPSPGVSAWIFGQNYYQHATTPVHNDTTFEYIINGTTTRDMAFGEYYMVLQHPMANNQFDVIENIVGDMTYIQIRTAAHIGSHPPVGAEAFIARGPGRLHGSDAAEALTRLINFQQIDDTYTKLSFRIGERPQPITMPPLPNPPFTVPTRFTVTPPTGLPKGEPEPGEEIEISTIIIPHGSSGVTFPGSDNLYISTDLDSPEWEISYIINGIPNPRPPQAGQTISISGFELEYPSGMDLKIQLSLKGNIPSETGTDDIMLLRICQVDREGNLRSGGEYIVTDPPQPIPTPPPTPDPGSHYFNITPPTGMPDGNLEHGTTLSIETTVSNFISGSGTTFPGSDTLQFYTDLESPQWNIVIVLNGIDNPRPVSSSKIHRISGFELEYPSGTSGFDVKVRVSLQGTVPQVTTLGDQAIILRIRQLDSSDRIRPGGEYRLTRAVSDPLPDLITHINLQPGWNFVSTPKRLAEGNNTAAIFADVDTAGRSIFQYNASSGSWEMMTPASPVRPLDAVWIYANDTSSIALDFDSGAVQVPPSKQLYEGWNAIGFSSTEPATARDTLITVSPKWGQLLGWNAGTQSYDTAIIRGGTGAYSDTREMQPMQGYWIAMTEPGVLYALS